MNQPNMTLTVDIGPDGLGKLRVEDLSPLATTDLSVSEAMANVAIGQVDGPDGSPLTFIFVSGAKPNSQVTVAYYTPGE